MFIFRGAEFYFRLSNNFSAENFSNMQIHEHIEIRQLEFQITSKNSENSKKYMKVYC